MGYLYGEREQALVTMAFKMLSVNKTVTFENTAMFLNLINNVYVPGEECEQEQQIFETSDSSARVYGFIDKDGRFSVNSQAEVLEICKKF